MNTFIFLSNMVIVNIPPPPKKVCWVFFMCVIWSYYHILMTASSFEAGCHAQEKKILQQSQNFILGSAGNCCNCCATLHASPITKKLNTNFKRPGLNDRDVCCSETAAHQKNLKAAVKPVEILIACSSASGTGSGTCIH